MAPPEIRTPRLLLRPVRPADAAALTAILQEPSVARHWHGYDAARVQVDLVAPEDEVVFALEDAGDPGRVIGAIQYTEQPEPDYRHASIDLFLGTAWQGRGLGGEAIGAVVSHLVETLGHHRIVIDPAVDNERAIRAYERVGFRRVGVLREYERRPDGTYQDGLLMELLASEHRALIARGGTGGSPRGHSLPGAGSPGSG
jgi:aminoglycoside 6'-N-acetyltransferase